MAVLSRLALLAPVVAALLVTGLLQGERQAPPPPGEVDEVIARYETVVKRVEELRGLEFDERPEVEVVSAAEAREDILAELDERWPEERRLADTELLAMLGLIDPGADLREVIGDLLETGVAGFYEPGRGRIAVVGEESSAAEAEMTLAHELVHALEDQHFGLPDPDPVMFGDRLAAQSALIEGTATEVMEEYAMEHLDLLDVLESGMRAMRGVELPPPFLTLQLVLPYLVGMEFVAALREVVGGGWELVDRSLARIPPASTAQILDPELYLRGVTPVAVRIDGSGVAGQGWREIAAGDFGRLDTAALLGADDVGVRLFLEILLRGEEAFEDLDAEELLEELGPAELDELLAGAMEAEGVEAPGILELLGLGDKAEGWRGGAYQLLRIGPFPDGCPAPCRERQALLAGWLMAAPEQARALADELRDTMPDASVSASGERVGLAVAPDPGLAQALAEHAAGD